MRKVPKLCPIKLAKSKAYEQEQDRILQEQKDHPLTPARSNLPVMMTLRHRACLALVDSMATAQTEGDMRTAQEDAQLLMSTWSWGTVDGFRQRSARIIRRHGGKAQGDVNA